MLILLVFLGIQALRTGIHNRQLRNTISKERSQFTTWQDSLGRSHATLKQETIYLEQATGHLREQIDSQAALLRVKPKDIKSITTVTAQTTGTVTASIDTNNKFNFDDGHLVMNGEVKRDSSAKDSIKAPYTYTDKAKIVFYKKPVKIFGVNLGILGNHDYIDVAFDNPNTKISGLSNITLKEYAPPKNWGVGPQLGVTYFEGNIRPYIGVGISYYILKW